MWSGVILMKDDAFTSCQFWPLFLDFFVQFHQLATVDIRIDILGPWKQLKINNTPEIPPNTQRNLLLMNLTTFSEFALRFYLFGSNKVKCDGNDCLESLFQVNAKQ